MVQEFYVLKCYSCGMYQVQIVKKQSRWACKMCGEKQSVIKIILRSFDAKECRSYVQELNAKNIHIPESTFKISYEDTQTSYLGAHKPNEHCDRNELTSDSNRELSYDTQKDSAWHSKVSDNCNSNSKWHKYLNDDQIKESIRRSTNYMKSTQEEPEFSIGDPVISDRTRKFKGKKLSENQYSNKKIKSIHYRKTCSENPPDNLKNSKCTEYVGSSEQVRLCDIENQYSGTAVRNEPIPQKGHLPDVTSKWSKYLNSFENNHTAYNNANSNDTQENHDFQIQHKDVLNVQSIKNPKANSREILINSPIERDESILNRIGSKIKSEDNKSNCSTESSRFLPHNREVANDATNKIIFDCGQENLDFSI